MMSWSESDLVLSEQCVVFPMEAHRWLAVLQSRVHEVWARLLSSSLEDRLRYAPSDCFETFPFPEVDSFASLDAIGEATDTNRGAVIKAEAIGLTSIYNRLKDPGIIDPTTVALRTLHEKLDHEVLAAYGWADIKVPPFCGATPTQIEVFEDEVIDRLFKLNETRADAEARDAPPVKRAPKKRTRAKA